MKSIFKVTLFLIIPIFFRVQSQAQAQNNDIRNSMVYKLQKGVYNRAVKYNDSQMALNALYTMCVLEPQNDSILVALEYIYFNNQQYFSAVLVANDALLLNPNNTGCQEMKAISLEQIGAKDKALGEYETLYLKNNQNVEYLFKMAELEVGLKRYKEAETNADILLTKKVIDSLSVNLPKGDNDQQQVNMRATVHNMKGIIERELGNTEEAKKQFGIALEIMPDFFEARKNLDALLKPAK